MSVATILKGKKLSVFSLSLITITSVDSIRNLPVAALAGSQLIHYFLLALVFFLLPVAIVSAWFSDQSSQGVFGWVKKGLGKRAAFMAIWFQCVQNVLIYPTMLSFIAGTLLYSIDPALTNNKPLLFFVIVLTIWGLTWINLRGIALSSRFNSFCTLLGLILPFIIILAMGLYWYLTQIPAGSPALPPAQPYSWTALTAIILSFCGLELAAVHAEDSKPGAFPKAIVISLLVIFLTMLLGSATLAMIIPNHQLNFVSSIPELIQLFFNKLHAGSYAFLINALIALGCVGASNNWLIAPIKGLGFAAEEGFLSQDLAETNEHRAPAKLLLIQAVAVTLISTLFLIFPTVNTSYWIMLNAATQINLLMYLLLFIAALVLAMKAFQPGAYKVILASLLGLAGVAITLIVSLTPPPSLQFSSQLTYALFGGLFLLLMAFIPIWARQRN